MTPEFLSRAWADGVRGACNHLWQSTLVLGIVALLTFLLRKNPARIRYRLWMAASAKFLIPFSLLVALGSHLPWSSHALAPKTTTYAAIEEMSQPFLQGPARDIPMAVPVAQPLAPHLPIRVLPIMLAAVWLSGFIAMMSFWCVQWRRISRLVRSAKPLTEGREVDLLRKAERAAKLSRPVPLLLSGNSIEPGVFGILRPVLLWPEGIARHMDDAHLESVLAHEACHVQRRDNLTSALHMLVEAIFWFHPLAWWIERQLVKERERACDEAVLQLGNEAAVYAESILNICKFYTESPIACVSGVTGSELKQRIARIMSGETIRKLDLRRKAMLALACGLAVGVPLAAGLLRAAQGQAQTAQSDGVEKGSIAGTWQGTEHTPDGHDLRMVLKIAKDEKGALSATLYSLDQTESPVNSGSVRFHEGKLRFVNDFPGLTYEGTMSADGNSVSGTITYARRSLPLALERAKPRTEWAIPAAPTKNALMASDAKPDVEVATIKPTQPGNDQMMFQTHGGTLLIKNLSLGFMMSFAYDLPARQITGKPGWVDTDKWDIEAKADTPGEPNPSQLKMMMQKLFAERFGLRVHEGKRKIEAYVLIVSKAGPKMTKTADASSPTNVLLYPQGVIIAKSATIANLAHWLGSIFGQPVMDETGLEGRWDFTMRWTPDETQFADVPESARRPAGDANLPPPLFTAIQQQLGLKLEAQKTEVPVLVIDHVDHPSPN
ncbi:MAG TPA: M56 family metallopeptidase [Acidobacteriaceae bacterium]|nr:M56 family metallopeptidase [Acidobacteriaceae bacterium]